MPQIIVSGADVARNPTINSNSSAGYQGQGQITVGAQSVFQADDVIVLQINRVDGNGEISPSSNSGLADVTVYDSYSDYLAGNVKFHYAPQNPGQTANVQSDVSGLGDGYVRFVSANIMIPQNGGPSFNQLFVAPGSGIGQTGSGTFSTKQQFDFNGDNDFNDFLENGNTNFFVGNYATAAPVCFVRGTKIRTLSGDISIEDLRIGQQILTLDNGYQPLRWIGSTECHAIGNCAPILFKPYSFGNRKGLLVSQQHRMLVTGWQAEILFGTSEVLAPAKFFVNNSSIIRKIGGTVEYFHILFDNHQLVYANDVLTESFHPKDADGSLSSNDTLLELQSLFPELCQETLAQSRVAVRPTLKRHESEALASMI